MAFNKVYPPNEVDLYASCQYVVDTFLNESLYLVLRDQFFSPQYPSALSIAAFRLSGHLIRQDLYAGISEELVNSLEIMKPFKN